MEIVDFRGNVLSIEEPVQALSPAEVCTRGGLLVSPCSVAVWILGFLNVFWGVEINVPNNAV